MYVCMGVNCMHVHVCVYIKLQTLSVLDDFLTKQVFTKSLIELAKRFSWKCIVIQLL